jgi:hypothetical protein
VEITREHLVLASADSLDITGYRPPALAMTAATRFDAVHGYEYHLLYFAVMAKGNHGDAFAGLCLGNFPDDEDCRYGRHAFADVAAEFWLSSVWSDGWYYKAMMCMRI